MNGIQRRRRRVERAGSAVHDAVVKRASILPWAWWLGWALVYLGTLTSRYAYDGIAYCGEIVLALSRGTWREVVHTSHLLFSVVAPFWVQLTGGLGAEVAVHTRLQLLQALLGAATIAALLALLRRRVATPVAVGAAACVGCAYSFWRYTTDVEVYSLVALAVVAALAAALRAADAPTPINAAIAGLACSLATLGHLTSGLFAAATLPLLLAWAPAQRFRIGLSFSAAYAAVVGGVVGALVFGPAGAGRPEGRLGFLLGYMQEGGREQFFGWPWRQIQASLATVAHALVASTPGWIVAAIAPAMLGLAAAALIATRGAGRGLRRAVVLAIAWLGTHTLFFFAWECHEKYWIAALPEAALLLAVACDQGLRRLAPGWRAAPAIALAAGLAAANLPALRHDMAPEHNRALQVAQALRTATPPNAQVVVSGLEPWRELKVYVPYFAERTPVILDFLLVPTNRPRMEAAFERVAVGAPPPTYVLRELLAPEGARARLESRHGLAPGALAAFFAALCPRPLHPLPAGEQLYLLQPCPTLPSNQ